MKGLSRGEDGSCDGKRVRGLKIRAEKIMFKHSAASLGAIDRNELKQIAKGFGLKQNVKSAVLIFQILEKQSTTTAKAMHSATGVASKSSSFSSAPAPPHPSSVPSSKRFRVLEVFDISSDEDDHKPVSSSSPKRHSSSASRAVPPQGHGKPFPVLPPFAMSASESLREEGNHLFTSAFVPSLLLRRTRLIGAKDMYTKAFAAALNSGDRASAQGNIAAVYRRLLENCEPSLISAFTDSYLHHASLSIKYGSEPNSKPPNWMLAKKLEILKMTQDYCRRRDNEQNFSSYIGRLYHSAFGTDSKLLIPEVRLTLLHAVLKQHFQQAVKYMELEKPDHKGGIQQLEDSRRSSIEAEELCRQHPPCKSQAVTGTEKSIPQLEEVELFAEIESDLAVLRQDCLLQMSVARSGQMIMIGNEALDNAVFGSGVLSTYGVQDAIDCFRQAIVHARGVDVEHEAWANSRLGHTFSTVLKQPANGHLCYKNCIFLAMSLYESRRCDSQPWFIEANRTAEAYQEQMKLRDQAEIDKRRAPILKALSVELELLKTESRKGADELLTFLYEKYGTGFPARDADVSSRKQLLKAITLFHPDKCDQGDLQKKTLHEEIAKMLNNHYTNTK
jgi:hypothetical protein